MGSVKTSQRKRPGRALVLWLQPRQRTVLDAGARRNGELLSVFVRRVSLEAAQRDATPRVSVERLRVLPAPAA